MKKAPVALQIAALLAALAWVVDVVVHRADIVLSSPFPQWEVGQPLPSGFVLFFLALLIYVLAAFRMSNYWRRFYSVLLFFGAVLGVFYILALFGVTESWIVYGIAVAVVVLNRWNKRALVHTAIQSILIIGVTVWAGVRFSPLHAALLLGVFSLYDLISGFFPKQMFDAVTKFFQADHLVSLIFPNTLKGWWQSQHNEHTTPVRAIDILLPLVFAVLFSYSLGTLTYWIIISGWILGIVGRLWLPTRLQRQLIIPFLGALLGYGIALLL